MSLSIMQFDQVRELLNHRAEEDYAHKVTKAVDPLAAVLAAEKRIQRLFPDIKLSPYVNSARGFMPGKSQAHDADGDVGMRAA